MISYAFLKININVLNHCDIVLSRSSPSHLTQDRINSKAVFN
jgi:hypothetical protein